MPKLFDAHTHLNLAQFDADRDEVARRTLDQDAWFVNVGTDRTTSSSAIDIANAYEKGVYAAIGLHPLHAHEESFDESVYETLAKEPKVVAIGECGLDYFRSEDRELQRETFIRQIELANRVGKPLMLHIRNKPKSEESAYRDAAALLKEYATVPGNVHFFAGNIDEAKPFLDMGYSLSFTGVITFASEYDEVLTYVPEDRILSETDAPYVAPVPYRGSRNEPLYVGKVVERIAEIRGDAPEEVARYTVENALKLFKIAVL